MAMSDMNEIYNLEKWDAFCERLIRMTINDELIWEDWSSRFERPDSLSPLFVAAYKDWHILAYSYRTKEYNKDGRYDWAESAAVEFTDHAGRSRWRVPKGIFESCLVDQIQFKYEQLGTLLEEIISEELHHAPSQV